MAFSRLAGFDMIRYEFNRQTLFASQKVTFAISFSSSASALHKIVIMLDYTCFQSYNKMVT